MRARRSGVPYLLVAAGMAGGAWALPAVPVVTEAALAATAQAPSAAEFRAPRETWERLTRALARHNRAAALQELTPAARTRYAEEIDTWLAARHFDAERFGRVRSVTLSGDDFATVSLSRRKEDGVHAGEAMLMRGQDGRWRVDRM